MVNSSDLARLLSGFLAPHVYVCQTTDHVVLLDTQRNRYQGLSFVDCEALIEVLVEGTAIPASVPRDVGLGIESQMRKLGMLSHAPTARSSEAHFPAEWPLFDGFPPFRSILVRRAVRNAAISWMEACNALWTGNIQRHIETANNRALRQGTGPLTVAGLQSLVASYFHCRIWFFSAAGKCLLDSLTLHGFLSRYGVPSVFVIGVRTAPFGAHAWVQTGACVLNDDCETVNAYEKIYASPVTCGVHRDLLG